jgi:putative transposase
MGGPGRRLKNAVRGDALKRLDEMRADPDYAATRALPMKTKARTPAFAACRKRYVSKNTRYTPAPPPTRTPWASRVLLAHTKDRALGRAGRPRFKCAKRPQRSIEGKFAVSGLRWHAGIGALACGKNHLPATLPPV